MIFELVFGLIFSFIGFIISLLPDFSELGGNFDISGLVSFLSNGFIFFPFDIFSFFIKNVLFWLTVQIGWAIVEWCYKKVPGVN